MSSYYGTDEQQRMQKKSDRLTPWIMRTPGACLTGRAMCSDDPEMLGWDIIHQHLREDGLFSFRWVDHAGLEQIKREIKGLGASIHGWEGYLNDADHLQRAIKDNLSLPLPPGMKLEIAQGEAIPELQAFLVDQGIVPLSGAVHEGKICKASSPIIRSSDGRIAAAGFVGMLQNEYSPLHHYAWGGLIASDPDQRGKGLGRRITSEVIRIALESFGARHVMGFAASDNHASKSMLSSCGLQPCDHASYVATLSGARFTR